MPDDKLPKVLVSPDSTPSTYNNPLLAQRFDRVSSQLLGKNAVMQLKPIMGGEDFGMYGRVEPKIPSLIFWIGGGKLKDIKSAAGPIPNHSPHFTPDPEPTLKTGVSVMTGFALDLFKSPVVSATH